MNLAGLAYPFLGCSVVTRRLLVLTESVIRVPGISPVTFLSPLSKKLFAYDFFVVQVLSYNTVFYHSPDIVQTERH